MLENGLLLSKFDLYEAFRGPGETQRESRFDEDETHYFIQDYFDEHGELPDTWDVMDHFEYEEEHQQEVEKILYQYQLEGLTYG